MWLPFQAGLVKHLARRPQFAGRRCVMLSVEYSLSPDAKWPQALKEVLSVHQWLTMHCRFPASNIVFMGSVGWRRRPCARSFPPSRTPTIHPR